MTVCQLEPRGLGPHASLCTTPGKTGSPASRPRGCEVLLFSHSEAFSTVLVFPPVFVVNLRGVAVTSVSANSSARSDAP